MAVQRLFACTPAWIRAWKTKEKKKWRAIRLCFYHWFRSNWPRPYTTMKMITSERKKKMNSMCGRRCWIIMRRINTQCSTELQQKNESIKTWSILPCQKFYIRFRIFSLWNNQSSYIQHHVQNVCFFNISIFFIIIGAETNGKKRVGKEKKYTLHHQYTEFEFLVFTSDLHQGERNCLNN